MSDPDPRIVDLNVSRILEAEGGVSDVGDGAGLTRYGQTSSWLNQWRLPLPHSRDEAAMNYRSWLERTDLDALCTVDDALAWITLDFAVNSGERVAIAALQRALGTKPDGVLGPATMTALAICDRPHVACAVLADRLELDGGLIAHHPQPYATFALGWARRCAEQLRSIA